MKFDSALLIPILTSAVVAGCSDSGGDAAGVTEWLGEETHLAISGNFQGSSFDVSLEGEEASSVYCNRLYTPLPNQTPDADGNFRGDQVYFAMKELGGIIEVDGAPKEFTVSYWRHDAPGATVLEVVPREFGTSIPTGKTWSDINMFEPGANLLSGVESAASSGTVNILLNTGAAEGSGEMVNGGRTGEFVSISWGPRESLNISVTADCTTIVVPWAGDLVNP